MSERIHGFCVVVTYSIKGVDETRLVMQILEHKIHNQETASSALTALRESKAAGVEEALETRLLKLVRIPVVNLLLRSAGPFDQGENGRGDSNPTLELRQRKRTDWLT